MDITLISRYYDTRNKGLGSYSKLIYECLKNEPIKLNRISQDQCILNSFNKFSYLFYSMIDLKRIINKKEFKNSDIFHGLTPLESMHLPKHKSVSTILDLIPLYEAKDFYSNIYAKLYYKSIKSSIKSERIIVMNSNIKKSLIEDFNVDESIIEMISPPIDAQYYPFKKEDDSFVVGTVSTLCKRKRIDLLIKSFLEADIENSKLLIGGNGEDKEKLLKLAKNDERIKFLGFIPDEKMNEFYNSLDVFVFPTKLEGYGMPMVEAMACKKPVITLEDADIPMNIKEKTYVCSKDELSKVLLNKEFKCDLKKNMDFYNEHSLKNISSKLIKVYESI